MEKYQTFAPRLGALLIDMFIFLPLGIFDVWIKEANISPMLYYIWLPILNLAFPIYTIATHSLYGQTLGKMATKVKVLDVAEKPITFQHAFLREFPQLIFNFSLMFIAVPQFSENEGNFNFSTNPFGSFLFIVMMVYGFANIIVFLYSDKRRALHDYIAGTVVVKTDRMTEFQAGERD